MNAELIDGDIGATPMLLRRATAHAALADPHRLAVVDELLLGDVSPGQLGELLGIPSNLLAHHIRVLEKAGLISRTRSESDRRRCYMRLDVSALGGLLPRTDRVAARVVFVCTANSARSQLAAALWRRSSRVPAASAGISPAPRLHPGAVAAARRHGLALARKRPRRIADVVESTDLVITVCDNAREELGPDAQLHWSVPDPVPLGSDAAFDLAFDELARRIDIVAPRLTGI